MLSGSHIRVARFMSTAPNAGWTILALKASVRPIDLRTSVVNERIDRSRPSFLCLIRRVYRPRGQEVGVHDHLPRPLELVVPGRRRFQA